MENKSITINCDETLYSALKDKRVFFNLVELSGKKRKNVEILSYSLDKKILVVPGASIKLQDIARLDFKGKNAVRFFKEILPEIPESNQFKVFEGKPFYIYPYASPFEKWELVRSCTYYFILHRTEISRGNREREGSLNRIKPRKSHEYSIVYKLSLSLVKPFHPVRRKQISDGEIVDSHRAGEWREGAKEITKLILEEFKERGTNKLPVVLALKDGREVRGVLNKRNGITSFLFVLHNHKYPKEKIFVFKHAVDDFWVEDENLS